MKIHSFFTCGGRKDSHTLADSLISFMLVFCIMECLYMIYGYAPFGDKSLAWSDANIQYLDLFAYLKDVLEGNNNIAQPYFLAETISELSVITSHHRLICWWFSLRNQRCMIF